MSAKCSLDNGECAKMSFPGILKPQNVKFLGAAILFSQINMKKMHNEATEVHSCTFSDRAWRKLTSFFKQFFCILQYG